MIDQGVPSKGHILRLKSLFDGYRLIMVIFASDRS